jgi:hypothetical protein
LNGKQAFGYQGAMTCAAQVLMGFLAVAAGSAGEGRSPTAPPAEEPLLVIVERNHGATATPEQVRRAIAAELGRAVVGPADAAGKTASQMLVVTLGPDSVSMQVRSAGDAAPRRRIEPLTGGDSNLRVVAWLAGNLARDQAGELTDARLAAAPAARSTPAPAAQPAPRLASTQPPPQPEPDAVATTPAGAVRRSDGTAPWRLELSVGRALSTEYPYWYEDLNTLSFERIEILAPSRPGHWSWAAGLDVINNSGYDSHSYVVSGGFARRFEVVPGWLVTDAAIGGGLWVSRYAPNYVEDGLFYVTDATTGPLPVGYLTAGLSIVRLSAGEIVTTARIVDLADVWKYPFFTFSAGFRLAL